MSWKPGWHFLQILKKTNKNDYIFKIFKGYRKQERTTDGQLFLKVKISAFWCSRKETFFRVKQEINGGARHFVCVCVCVCVCPLITHFTQQAKCVNCTGSPWKNPKDGAPCPFHTSSTGSMVLHERTCLQMYTLKHTHHQQPGPLHQPQASASLYISKLWVKHKHSTSLS